MPTKIDNFNKYKFDGNKINENISRADIDDETLDDLLNTQKDNKEAFLILLLLYPNLDYRNGNFHKDHLHPKNDYEKLSQENKEKISWEQYNSIVNLQLLDANENESKNAKTLREWINNETENLNDVQKMQFYRNHLIPNDIKDFSIDNVVEFYNKRKLLLKEELKKIL